MRRTPNALGTPEFVQRQANMRKKKKKRILCVIGIDMGTDAEVSSQSFPWLVYLNNHALFTVNDDHEYQCGELQGDRKKEQVGM